VAVLPIIVVARGTISPASGLPRRRDDGRSGAARRERGVAQIERDRATQEIQFEIG
jgi:hypothetical protein